MMTPQRIMLVDNEEGLCRMMEAVLKDQGYLVKSYTRSVQAVAEFSAGDYELIISDIKMPEMDGLEVLKHVRNRDPEVPVIMITAYATVDMSIQALRRGAYDMLTKPFEPDELVYRVKNALQHHELMEENRELREELSGQFKFENIIGASSSIKSLLEKVAKVAIRDTSVLITGESGTGKELVAQAVHHNSSRRNHRFVALNCGAMPENILESELFGYRKGAFTGAMENRKGLLEAANGGTLFLDEIGNLPLTMQKTLLRFLQEKEFRRLGDTTPTKVDVRIISATNSDLTAEVAAGTFREDLFYRLNVINLHLPPLRDRQEDIPLLAVHFIRQQNARFSTDIKGLTPEAMQALRLYEWPGNIRQLCNVIEAAMTIASGNYIGLPELTQLIETGKIDQTADQADYSSALGQFETEYLTRLLRKHGGNVEEAATEAKMNMATIYRKLKKYGINRKEMEE
ncbi:MAG: sigma-54-dependent Fis family transcriptional regulator [Deltaproteobacteria bacterium]|nr:sigma-54-dependent Fis family transcriptional regulator [Deltaproteobacteria bacterium]